MKRWQGVSIVTPPRKTLFKTHLAVSPADGFLLVSRMMTE